MEKLPRGSNFTRAKLLWELGLNVAGNPATPYGGDRDMTIVVGNGSGAEFRPRLRMATGSPVLAHAVADGSLEMAMVNPSALLTQAYRGIGMFDKPLPLHVVAIYPTWDWFTIVLNPKSGITSLHEVREKRMPLHVSVKEDQTHATRMCTNQLLSHYGFSLDDIVSWGGRLNLTGSPTDARRIEALAKGDLDAIIDEAIPRWFDIALDAGMVPYEFEADALAHMTALGWQSAVLPKDRHKLLANDHTCLCFSGWPLYCRADLDEQLVYDVCASFAARQDEIKWEEDGFIGDVTQVFESTFATPNDVPLHAGAQRYLDERKSRGS
jgi:TRAP-type uncharacterized transport system substrate-binding protein